MYHSNIKETSVNEHEQQVVEENLVELLSVCFPVPDTVWRLNLDVPEEARDVSLDNTDERWWEQTELTKLILASNLLTEISQEISNFQALSVLDVSGLSVS